MSEDEDLDRRIRASLRGEHQIGDDDFSANVLAGIEAPERARASGRTAQFAGLGMVPLLVVLLALTGLMPTTLIETLLSALLLTGTCALAWIGTASDLPSRHVFQGQPPH